jgi:signal transduction histidine kinase
MNVEKEDVLALATLARGVKLILVEDEPDLLKRFEVMLSRFFTDIRTAGDANEAWTIYEAEHEQGPILLMSDVNLGMTSGIDLICRIRKLNPNQKVIAFSGTSDPQVFIDAIRCGIDRFVLKPIEMSELFDALRTVLQAISDAIELEESQQLLDASREYAVQLLAEQEEFLKNAIHEMHTPLSVIITNIDLMRLGGDESESLDAIEAASRIIQNSYSDMTYLMKQDAHREHTEPIDVEAFIRERITYFSRIATVNDMKIVLQLSQPRLPMLEFSPVKLTRIIDNTLSNAIKYAYHPSQIDVMVGVWEEKLYLQITNQGPLIKDKEKIFKRFYRESDHKGGYGLGLNIVDRICSEEGVTVDITSSEKRGTTFRYTFERGAI